MTASAPVEPSWPLLLNQLAAGIDLDPAKTAWAMDQLLTANCSDAQLAAFLMGLRTKGETVAELEGLVQAMLNHAVTLTVPGLCLDIVGTGGDGSNTVNISTMAAIVAAGAGQRVVKHGNRAASSSCGTADVLEQLGVRLDLSPKRVAAMVDRVGITFCFAQVFHPAMRQAAPVRRSLAIPTAFNFLGPLTNPAQPAASAIGCSDARMAPLMAGVFARRGTTAMVFRGPGGLDELGLAGPSDIWLAVAGEVQQSVLDPAELGLPRAPLTALSGGSAAVNAQAVSELLAGAKGPIRDAVILNAAAGLVVAELAVDQPVDGAPGDLRAGSIDLPKHFVAALDRARESLDSAAAQGILTKWVAASAAG